MKTIYAIVDSLNHSAQKSMEKSGFKPMASVVIIPVVCRLKAFFDATL
jgi:hypothetical protein